MKRLLPALGVAALCCFPCLLGCAVGKTASGEAVIGVTAGISPDADAAQAAGAAIGSLFGPGGAVIGGTVATAVAGLLGWARSAGRHKGWSEREEAAAVQQRLPAPGADAPVAGGDPAVEVKP